MMGSWGEEDLGSFCRFSTKGFEGTRRTESAHFAGGGRGREVAVVAAVGEGVEQDVHKEEVPEGSRGGPDAYGGEGGETNFYRRRKWWRGRGLCIFGREKPC